MNGAPKKQLPSVRGACESCHTRKVRCELPAEGGACVNCQNANRQCYFLPRVRSGRPRGDVPSASASSAHDASNGARERAPTDTGYSHSWSHNSNNTSTYSKDSPSLQQTNSNAIPNESRYADSAFDVNSAPLLAPLISDAPAFDSDTQSPFLGPELSADTLMGNADFLDQNTLDHSTNMASVDDPAAVFQSSMLDFPPSDMSNPLPISDRQPQRNSYSAQGSHQKHGSQTSATTNVVPERAEQRSASGDKLSFSAVLELANSLQSHTNSIAQCLTKYKQGLVRPDMSITTNRALQSLLQCVDCACTSISSTFGPAASQTQSRQPSSAPQSGQTTPISPRQEGSVALLGSGLVAVAAVLQILHAFDLIVQYRPPDPTYAGDFILLYKRCEFNLMQTKIALTQVARLFPSLQLVARQTVARATALEAKFANTIKGQSHFWS